MKVRNIVLLWLAAGLFATASGAGKIPRVPLKKKDNEQKQAEQRQKEVKKAAKDERNYEKLKEFSLNLYQNDPEFREAVEKKYEQILQTHTGMAFDMNVLSPPSQTVVVREDRFRQYSGLYDNLVIQDYVNRLGQKLVPEDSDKLFAFRLVSHPVPYAHTLATGTIYISTGLVALLDNEAQLIYVLGHEMAHVYKEHYKLKPILELGEPEYNEKQQIKRAFWTAIAAGVGAGIGGAIDRSKAGAGYGALAGAGAGYIVGSILNPTINLDWDKVQEDEADRIAFKAALDNNYDINEVPKLYLALQNAGQRDSRATLGFLGSRRRVKERIENVKDLIQKSYKAELELKQKEGKLVGDNPEYRHLMAELKRDNGIMAYYYDMFQIAKANLSEAVSIRTNDSTAQYFYGKVLKLVARTPEERKQADDAFTLAAKYDTRHQNFGTHLHRALAMMDDKSEASKARIVSELQGYVNNYLNFSVNNARGRALLPPHLDTIYDYMTLLGDTEWTPKLPDDTPMFIQANAQAPAAPAAQPTPAVPVTIPAAQPTGPALRAPARLVLPVRRPR